MKPIPVISRRCASLLALATLALVGTMQSALADNELWVGIPGITATTNWSDDNNWSGSSHNPNNNSVFFGNGSAVGLGVINSVVDTSTNCYSLSFTNTLGYNTVLIASGQTLTIDGNNGGPALDFIPGGQVANTNIITGADGTILITGSSAGGVSVTVTNSTATGIAPTLDLSGLGTLIISNVDSTAALLVGAPGNPRAGGILKLAMTNYLNLPSSGSVEGNAGALVVGYNNGNSSSSPGGVLYLGQSNQIFAGNIAVGLSKQNAATMAFNPAFTNNNPVVYIRGHNSTAVTNWAIADGINTSGTSTGPGGTVNFNNGTVDAVVDAMWIAKPSQTSATAPTATGTLSFSAGIISVNLLTNGCALPPTTGGPSKATATINVNGTGTLAVNTNLELALLSAGDTSSSGTLNITGNGTVQASTITPGGGTSVINMLGGTLIVTNTAGTTAAPLSILSVSNSILTFSVAPGVASTVVTTLNYNGTADTINIATLPTIASFPAQYPLITYSGINGVFDFNLGTLPSTYQGYISNDTANASVDLVITNTTLKTDVWNGNVNGDWDVTTLNWWISSIPGSYTQGDDVKFDDTLTGTPNVILTTDLAPSGVEVNDSAKNYVFSGSGELSGTTGLTKDGSGSLTLAETGGDSFTGGIVVDNGTLVLDNANSTISGGLTINSTGTVQIGNNDANGTLPTGTLNDDGALVFDRTDSPIVAIAIPGSGTLTQSGSGTLTLSAANTYTGNTTVGNGTLALTGAGAIADSSAVSVSSATLDVSGVSGSTTLNNLTLANASLNVKAGYLQTNLNVASLTLNGTANTINVLSLPPIANYPATITLLQSAGGINGYNFVLGTLPVATPPYAGSIAESGGQAVQLTLASGPIGVRPSVTWSGADAMNTGNTNWSDAQNWQTPGAPSAGENVVFNDIDAASGSPFYGLGSGPSGIIYPNNINNNVNANFTIGSLTYTNINSDFQNTWIGTGLTLSITNSGSLTVGSGSVDFGANAEGAVTIGGTNGTLDVSNTNGTVFVGLGSASSGSHEAVLDLSGLGTFNASVSRLLAGVGASSDGIAETRETGVIYLAQTNVITAALAVSGTETSDTGGTAVSLDVGDADGSAGSANYLYLGQTNAIFADAVGVGRQKATGSILFNPAWAGAGLIPSAYFRGQNGVGPVATWSDGDGVGNSGTATCSGTSDFTGGYVNALVTTMYVGSAANSTTSSGTATGTLIFGNGIFNVGTLYDGYQPVNSEKIGIGTVNVNNDNSDTGGTLVVGTLYLGVTAGGTGAASTAGTLNLNGGNVQAGTIVAGTNGAISTITLNGGSTLTVATAGTPAAPLTTLNLYGGTLQLNVNGPSTTNIVVTSLGLSGTTVINLGSVLNLPGPTTVALISYTGGDPFNNLTLGTLPTGYAGQLVDDAADSIIGLQFTTVAPPVSHLAISQFSLSGANVTISGMNQGTGTYYVLTSTNLALPLSQWKPAATNVLTGSGSFTFTATNAVLPNASQQFYILSTTNN